MARARNIKPAFFKNETLVELPFEHRLLFVGLWTLADREGRLEDRAKRIKMEIFPADNVDVDTGLGLLANGGFIQRYAVNGVGIIQVLNFAKHQTPHHTERQSELPDVNGELTVKPQKPNGGNPSDSLNPDSLNPDSLNPESLKTALAPPPCPTQQIIELYAACAPSMVQARIVTDAVKATISARWKQDPIHQKLEFWKTLFDYCEANDFLSGRKEGRGGKPFRVGLEWIVKSANFAKIINGNFDND